MLRKKFQKFVFILLLILLPTQLGLHFWPSWSYVSGIRVDYFSPTIYLTDILIFLLMAPENYNLQFKIFNKFFNLKFSIFIAFVFFNIYFSLSPEVSSYKWLKFFEFGFLAYFVSKKPPYLSTSLPFLLIPLIYESVLAIWQFINQGSIGGWWYWFGERSFNVATPGIAKAIINGQLVLRPYGTFSHPNVLAGFLVVTGLIFIRFSPHISRKINATILVLIILVGFLTLSRGNLVSGFNLRQQLNMIAVEQWTKFPIIGTGLGTSPLYPRKIQNYALVHQPIHNIYLLLLSETGMIGLGIFVFLIIKLLIRRSIIHNTLYIILILGLFDHYFLTLQQSQLLLSLTVGLAWVRMKKE